MSAAVRHRITFFLSLCASSLTQAQTYFSGTITDSNHQPVAGAIVQAGQASFLYSPFQVLGQATSDAQGHYAITSLGAGDGSGNYVLFAQSPGRVSIVYPNTGCYFLYPCPLVPLAPTVAAPNLAADFTLPHPASIAGHVTRTDTNAPVTGVRLGLSGGSMDLMPNIVTDASGGYEVHGLLPGTYQLAIGFSETPDQSALLPQVYAAHDYDALSQEPSGDAIVLGDGESVSGVDFALHRGGTITGSVNSIIEGHPVAASIGILRLTPAPGGSDFTALGGSGRFADPRVYAPPPGQYVLQPLLPGTFEIRFGGGQFSTEYYPHAASVQQAQAVTVGAGQTVSGIDGTVLPYQTISGHITDKASGNPAPNVIVHAGPGLNGFPQLLDTADALTDAGGSYRIEGLPPGSMYVWVTGNGTYLDQVYPDVLGCCFQAAGTQPVPLAANEYVNGIDMALTAGASLSGHVVDAETGAGVANIPVSLVDSSATTSTTVRTDASGAFVSTTVATGNYYVDIVFGQGYEYYPNYYCAFTATCDLSNAQLQTFSAPQRYQLEFPVLHLDRVFRAGFE